MLACVGNLREMSWQNWELHELSSESCCTETLKENEEEKKSRAIWRTSLANDFFTSMVPDQRGKSSWVSIRSAGQTNVNLLIRTQRRHPPNRPKSLICNMWKQVLLFISNGHTCSARRHNRLGELLQCRHGCWLLKKYQIH